MFILGYLRETTFIISLIAAPVGEVITQFFVEIGKIFSYEQGRINLHYLIYFLIIQIFF